MDAFRLALRGLVTCLSLALWSCSPEATSISIRSFSIRPTAQAAVIDAVVEGDGQFPTLTLEVRRGTRVISSLSANSARDVDPTGQVTQSYSETVPIAQILDATDAAATGATIDVAFTVTAEGGGLTSSRSATARVGCGADSAICGGACTNLESDADNCGQCGTVCTVQLTSDRYKGRCLSSTCNWPAVTLTAPSTCGAVCDGILFQGRTIKNVNRCGYAASGAVLDSLGVYVGAVVRSRVTGNSAYVLPGSTFLPAWSNVDGDFLRQICCCGP